MSNVNGFRSSPLNKHIFAFLLMLALLIAINITHSQSLYVDHIGLAEGLSQNSVLAINQDAKGFMWFGGYDGLNRFDGYEFKVYKPDANKSGSISGNSISSLFVDHQNLLWVGTYAGLNKYNHDTDSFTVYMHEPDNEKSLSYNYVLSVTGDSQGFIWTATRYGLNRFNPAEETFERFFHDPDNPNSISHDTVNTVYEDKQGIIWVGTNRGLNQFDSSSQTFNHFGDKTSFLYDAIVVTLTEDKHNRLWIGTDGSGIFVYDKTRKTFTHHQHDPRNKHSLSTNRITTIFNDSKNRLWIATYDRGLNRYNDKLKQFIYYPDDPENINDINDNKIYSLYEDRFGLLWVGTSIDGVAKINSTNFALTRVSNKKTSLNPDPQSGLRAFLVDSQGALWTGSDRDGLRVRKPNGFESVYMYDATKNDSLSNDQVYSIFEDHTQTIWIGTGGGGLNRYNRENNSFTHFNLQSNDFSSLQHGQIRSIIEDNKGTLWVGDYGGGVHIFDRQHNKFKHYHHHPADPNTLSSNNIFSIHEDREGNIWIATFGGGLNMFDRDLNKFIYYKHNSGSENSISHNYLLSIHEDRVDDKLWLGSNGGGIDCFDLHTKTFTNYNTEHGLPNNVVYGILQDDQNYLWLTTNRGLSRFDPKNKTFKNYDVRDGLQSNEFNGGAYYEAPDGKLYIGGINGYNAFYPDDIVDNPHKPIVYITEFQLFNKTIAANTEYDGRILLNKPISDAEKLVLSHKDSVFSFKFAALDYILPSKNQYAYKMEGLEDLWNYVDNRRFATYTTLPPGDYTFRVKAANNDGLWNETDTRLAITITPPFWQTLWFKAIIGLLIILSAFTFHKIWVHNIKSRNKILEKKVKARTAELQEQKSNLEAALTELNETKNAFEESSQIATGVLHNVGNLLNTVNLSASFAWNNLQNSAIQKFLKANIKLRGNMDRLDEFILNSEEGKELLNYYLNLEKPITVEQNEFTDNIKHIIEKLTTIKDVIATQQSSAKGHGYIEYLSLETLIDQTVELQSSSANAADITFRKEYQPTPYVKVEKAKLIQVLMNLYKNAQESIIEANTADKIITIKITKDDSTIFIKVSDTGLGIKQEQIKNVFTYGFTTKLSGHGFGLHSCINYMQGMGGKICVESEGLGKGATFILQLPLQVNTNSIKSNGTA